MSSNFSKVYFYPKDISVIFQALKVSSSRNRQLLICIGHVTPLYDAGEYIFVTSNYQAARDFEGVSIVIPDQTASSYGYDGGVLSEYHQLFELLPILEKLLFWCDYVIVSQYRKIISHQVGLTTARHMPHLYWASPNLADSLESSFRENCLSTFIPKNWSVCSHLLTLSGTYAESYARLHCIDDYIKLHHCLIDSKLYDSAFIKFLFETNLFIPSSALGAYPLPLYLRFLKELRFHWRVYIDKGFLVAREGYQRRVGGFLLERLHSCLMLYAALNSQINLVPGFQYIISSDQGDARPTL